MHKINNIQQLYEDTVDLFNREVVGNADTIISYLKKGIEELKNSWKGQDAGIQINNVVTVYNGMVVLRNSLAEVCVYISEIARDYRMISNLNGARNEEYTSLKFEELGQMEAYSDTADTVDINQAADNGRVSILSACNLIETFVSNVNTKKVDILERNWTEGGKHEFASEIFNTLVEKTNKYISLLNQTSESITTALRNWENYNK